MRIKLRLEIRWAIGLAISAGLLLIINLLQPAVDCSDCFAPRGWPFIYYHEGGFAGGAAYVWTGVVGDFGLVLLAAFLIAWGLGKVFGKE